MLPLFKHTNNLQTVVQARCQQVHKPDYPTSGFCAACELVDNLRLKEEEEEYYSPLL
jgi:hypothetical protein